MQTESDEKQFFMAPMRAQLSRTRLACSWATTRFLLTRSADDLATLVEAQTARYQAIREILAVQALVSK